MKLLPSEQLTVDSALPPRSVVRAIPAAVDEVNRSTVLFGIRSRIEGDEVVVGYWPHVAFLWSGVAFVGRVSAAGERTVVSGTVALFPRWYARLVGLTLVLAATVPLASELGGPDRWMGVVGAAWLAGGGRLFLEIVFRAYRRRIDRALRIAAVATGA